MPEQTIYVALVYQIGDNSPMTKRGCYVGPDRKIVILQCVDLIREIRDEDECPAPNADFKILCGTLLEEVEIIPTIETKPLYVPKNFRKIKAAKRYVDHGEEDDESGF